jgi:dihydrofolate synthase/folylpolyglutamate synthase
LNSYARTIKFLYGLQRSGMKFGLRGIRALLQALNNPEQQFPAIHIAGTNGKGSTAALLASIFTVAGYKTGLYSSPHVVDFTERIRINGKPIARRDVVRHTRILQPLVRRYRTTFFETVTAMAFRHFAEQKVDIAIIETGLGGRLDATNVLRPLLSVITNIGLEHTEILGRTIPKIAFEKAGIIKPHTPCVTGERSAEALRVFRRIARQRGAPLVVVRHQSTIRHASILGTRFDLRLGNTLYRNLFLSLAGDHQIRNAALAIAAVDCLRKRGDFTLPERAIRAGLRNVERNSGIQARLSIIQSKPPMIADVAHNPDAIKALVKSFQNLSFRNFVLLFGVSRDKDYQAMVDHLKPIVDRAVVVAAKTERARPSDDLKQAFVRVGVPAVSESNVREGVLRAVALRQRGQAVLITGSHFVVGEALAYVRRKKYLTINQ